MLISLIKILFVCCSTLILVFRRSTRELLLESFFFALEAVCSGVIEVIFFKALGAVAVAVCAGALEAAAVAVCGGALEAVAAAVCGGALEAAAAAVTAAVARVTRLCLGLLRPSGVFMVPNLRFSRLNC